ncbi:hypothetical protein M422DRAFT_242899 [Sphaerobolus stellatus SS14]|nr:hypothetical protein M422DRAFT_242899 [Sphaerobolus stellatus SS14]
MDICTNIRERTHEKLITQYPLPIAYYRKPNDQNSIPNVLSWRSSGSPPRKLRFRLRDFYPSPHHQAQFGEWERDHPNGPAPGEGGNLCDLQDGVPGVNEGRPPHSHRTVLMCAIYGSPEKTLTLKELNKALRIRFPSYAKDDPNSGGWVNSVRHAQSRDASFVRIERPGKDYTKGGDQGSGWGLTITGPPDIMPLTSGVDQLRPAGRRQTDLTSEQLELSSETDTYTADWTEPPLTQSRSLQSEILALVHRLSNHVFVVTRYTDAYHIVSSRSQSTSPRTTSVSPSPLNTSFPLPSLHTTGLLEVEK